MALVPVDRNDLIQLLEAARRDGGLDDVVGRYDLPPVANPDDHDVPRTPAGDVAVDTVRLQIGDVTVSFTDQDGNPLSKDALPRCDMAIVNIPGVDPNRILRAEFDAVDYANPDVFRVGVSLLCKVPELQARSASE